MLISIPLLSLFVAEALSCAGHGGVRDLQTRSIAGRIEARQTAATTHDYEYDFSEDWGAIKPAYALCQNGTQQSPIALGGQGLTNAPLTFNYPSNGVQGSWYNTGFYPRFDLLNRRNSAGGYQNARPSLTFGSETVYLSQFHIHNPAEHTVDGVRTRAELHLVHVNAAGTARAVVAIRIALAARDSAWFASLPDYVSFRSEETVLTLINLQNLLNESGGFQQYFSYSGSLTSPPCDEGIRWIVGKNTMGIGSGQLQELLGASRYSARVLQPVWNQFA